MVVIFFSASICQPRFAVITVPADGLAPVGARPSTGAVMINGYVAIWGAVSTQWHRFTSTGIPTTKVLQNGVASALSWKMATHSSECIYIETVPGQSCPLPMIRVVKILLPFYTWNMAVTFFSRFNLPPFLSEDCKYPCSPCTQDIIS